MLFALNPNYWRTFPSIFFLECAISPELSLVAYPDSSVSISSRFGPFAPHLITQGHHLSDTDVGRKSS